MSHVKIPQWKKELVTCAWTGCEALATEQHNGTPVCKEHHAHFFTTLAEIKLTKDEPQAENAPRRVKIGYLRWQPFYPTDDFGE